MIRSALRRIHRLSAFAALLTAVTCAAQTGLQAPNAGTTTDLEPILQKLQASAKTITEALPSFTCREHIDSRQWKGPIVFRAVQLDSLFRDIRDTNPGAISPFFDSRTNPTDGSMLDLISHTPPLPLISGGTFWVTEQNVAPAERTDMRYKLLPSSPAKADTGISGSIHFAYRGTFPIWINGVHSSRRVGGSAWVDPSGRLLRTEVKARAPQDKTLTTVVDYAPVTLDGVAYDLPRRIHAELHDLTTTDWSDFTANYTGCNLFKATVRILPTGSN